MNEGFGKDFDRKGNSVKRSGPFSEPLDSENGKVAVQIHFPKISSYSSTVTFEDLDEEEDRQDRTLMTGAKSSTTTTDVLHHRT